MYTNMHITNSTQIYTFFFEVISLLLIFQGVVHLFIAHTRARPDIGLAQGCVKNVVKIQPYDVINVSFWLKKSVISFVLTQKKR